MVCRRLLISGKVQGVSFRFHTCELAAKLNLMGHVENLADGRVEIVVAGSLADVEQLINWTKIGPSGAIVKNVSVSKIDSEWPLGPFYIRR